MDEDERTKGEAERRRKGREEKGRRGSEEREGEGRTNLQYTPPNLDPPMKAAEVAARGTTIGYRSVIYCFQLHVG